MKQNLHTHTTYCDGKNTVSEMIRSALHKDFDVLGFSGHSFRLSSAARSMGMPSTKRLA